LQDHGVFQILRIATEVNPGWAWKSQSRSAKDFKMSDLTTFDFKGNQVRTHIDEHGEPWFVAVDVCRVLGFAHIGSALRNHINHDEKGVLAEHTPGGHQQLSTVSESGLYKLVMRSNKSEAQKFQDWVTREVLPQIRKTGSYNIADTTTAQIEKALEDLSALQVSAIRLSSIIVKSSLLIKLLFVFRKISLTSTYAFLSVPEL